MGRNSEVLRSHRFGFDGNGIREHYIKWAGVLRRASLKVFLLADHEPIERPVVPGGNS